MDIATKEVLIENKNHNISIANLDYLDIRIDIGDSSIVV